MQWDTFLVSFFSMVFFWKNSILIPMMFFTCLVRLGALGWCDLAIISMLVTYCSFMLMGLQEMWAENRDCLPGIQKEAARIDLSCVFCIEQETPKQETLYSIWESMLFRIYKMLFANKLILANLTQMLLAWLFTQIMVFAVGYNISLLMH